MGGGSRGREGADYTRGGGRGGDVIGGGIWRRRKRRRDDSRQVAASCLYEESEFLFELHSYTDATTKDKKSRYRSHCSRVQFTWQKIAT